MVEAVYAGVQVIFTPKICLNCRWWEQHGPIENNEGFCRLMGFTNLSDEATKYWQIAPRDAVGPHKPACWAKHDEVRTSPDFGCNQWECK